jgi:hypothetical protein
VHFCALTLATPIKNKIAKPKVLIVFLIFLFFKLFIFLYYLYCFSVIYECAVPPLAANGEAASRRRGFHKSSGGRCTSKFAQTFERAYTPALAKPFVICRFFNRSYLIFVFSDNSDIIRTQFGHLGKNISGRFCISLIFKQFHFC